MYSFNRKHKFVVLITNSLSKQTLHTLQLINSEIKLISEVENSFIDRKDNKTFNHYTKLSILEMVEYSKIIFPDGDLIICSNTEHLFDAPHMSAVIAGGLLNESWADLNAGFLWARSNYRSTFNSR